MKLAFSHLRLRRRKVKGRKNCREPVLTNGRERRYSDEQEKGEKEMHQVLRRKKKLKEISARSSVKYKY